MTAAPTTAAKAGPARAPQAAAPEERPRLEATSGRKGLELPLIPFRARVGGEVALRKVLAALTVTERVHPGRPRGMARTVRKAYAIERGPGGADTLRLPRIKGPRLLQTRTQAGVPLVDGIGEAPAGAGNAPLLPPRRLPAASCELAEPLYPYQAAAVAHLCAPAGPLGEAAVSAHCAVAYLQMDTGLGKSRVGLAVVAQRREPALVVVPTASIADQWVDECLEIYPDLRASVYHNPPKGSRRLPPGPATHDVVVVIINTFRDKGPEFLDGYGTMILDEAHEYQSPQNGLALWLAQTRAVLGLSATPLERPDGLDRYVTLHLGPVISPKMIPGYDVGTVNFRGAVRLIEYAGHPDFCETATTPAGTMSAVLTVANILKDPFRLRLVAAEVERLSRLHEAAPPSELPGLGLGPRPAEAADATHPAGEVRRHGVFVFAELREYLPALRDALVARLGSADAVYTPELDGDRKGAPAAAVELGPGLAASAAASVAASAEVSVLRGGVAKAAVSRARQAGAHVVLTTYGFSRRGISLPDMTAIVLASSRRNGLRQVLGRFLRRGSDESIVRQVVDIVDVRTGLRGQASDRRKVYAAKGYPLSKAKASWEDYAAPDDPPVPGAAPSGPPKEGGSGPAADEGDGDLSLLSTEDLLALVFSPEGR